MKKVCTGLLILVVAAGVQARTITILNNGTGSLNVKRVDSAQGKPNKVQIGALEITHPIHINNATNNKFTLEFKAPDFTVLGKVLKEGKSFTVDVPANTQDQTITVDSHGLRSMN